MRGLHKRGSRAVVGVFTYLDDALRAVELAKTGNFEYCVYSPVPNHALEHATMPARSNVRVLSLIGGISGLVGGFALAILCSLDWPLRTSAKPIVSVPAFVPVGYECTILLAAIFTLAALLHYCRIPDLFRKVGYDPRFSYDKFGVVVSCESEDLDRVKRNLLEAGADEVDVRDGL